MEVYKILFQMVQFGRGWKYVFYVEATNPKEAIDNVEPLRGKLASVHDVGTFVTNIAAANVARRQHGTRAFTLRNQNDIAGFIPDADLVTTAGRIQLSTGDSQSRSLWLRGLADSAVVRDTSGHPSPLPVWRGRVTNLITDIVAKQLRMRILRPVATNPFVDVLSIAAEADTGEQNTVVTLREPPPFLAGNRVLFKFDQTDRFLLGFKNSHRVLAVAGNTFTINVSYESKTISYNPVAMMVRKEEYDYPLITAGRFAAFGKKKTGRAPGPKGREAGTSFRH